MQGIRELVEPTGHRHSPGQRQAPELHLVKQGTVKRLPRSPTGDQSNENNSGGCTECHSTGSLEENLGTLSGEGTELQGFPQSWGSANWVSYSQLWHSLPGLCFPPHPTRLPLNCPEHSSCSDTQHSFPQNTGLFLTASSSPCFDLIQQCAFLEGYTGM